MKNNKDTIYHLPTVSHPVNDANEPMPIIHDSPERKEWIHLYGDLKKTKKKTKKKKRTV